MESSSARSPHRGTPGSDDTYLTPEDLSALLGIPVKTLAAWRSDRKGPLFYRLGVHVRYPKRHVDDWLAQCDAAATKWMAS